MKEEDYFLLQTANEIASICFSFDRVQLHVVVKTITTPDQITAMCGGSPSLRKNMSRLVELLELKNMRIH